MEIRRVTCVVVAVAFAATLWVSGSAALPDESLTLMGRYNR